MLLIFLVFQVQVLLVHNNKLKMYLLLFLLPNIALASFDSFLNNVNNLIVNPLINFLFAVALVFFLYGLFNFIANGDNESIRTEGKSHMLYGIIGMVIMMGVWGITNLLINTLEIEGIDPEKGEVNLEDFPE